LWLTGVWPLVTLACVPIATWAAGEA